MKKLNNKGFTLIELLAVVVILAVVMGIAGSSVISSMNKARGGSLEDSAIAIAQDFNTKYTESLIGGTGTATKVYANSLGSTFAGYNFTSTNIYTLDTTLADAWSIKATDIQLKASSTTAVAKDASSNKYIPSASFVKYDATKGKFIVCLYAVSSGKFYVASYAKSGVALTGLASDVKTPSTATVFACSDGQHSW